MRDPRIATFLQTWEGFTTGMISSDKPLELVSLSEVLEQGSIQERFFLSPRACAGILRRAEKRGKRLPEQLQRALETVANPLS